MKTRIETKAPEAGSPASAGLVAFEERLGKAMQDVWDEHCSDTGDVPTCIQSSNPRTTITGDFIGSSFVHEVAKLMRHRGEDNPNA